MDDCVDCIIRQGKFICRAQFRHKAIESPFQGHKCTLKDIKIALKIHTFFTYKKKQSEDIS